MSLLTPRVVDRGAVAKHASPLETHEPGSHPHFLVSLFDALSFPGWASFMAWSPAGDEWTILNEDLFMKHAFKKWVGSNGEPSASLLPVTSPTHRLCPKAASPDPEFPHLGFPSFTRKLG